MSLRKGFTLIEILIALFIFTIISMITVSIMHSVLTSQATTEANSTRFSELQTAVLMFQRDIEQSVDRPVTDAKGLQEQAFIGSSNNVTFTHGGNATSLSIAPSSTLVRTQYTVNSQQQLIRFTWPVLDPTPATTPTQRILLTHVTAFQLRYLDNNNQWHNIWPPQNNSKQVLPRAVSVTLRLSDLGEMKQVYIIGG